MSCCQGKGICQKGRPVNPVEPQKDVVIGGDKYFRRYRRHPELKSRKLAGTQQRSKQTLSSLRPFPMTAHSHPRTSPGAPGTMEHRKEELTLLPPAPLAPLLLTNGLAQVGERERGEKERDEGGVLRGGESSIPASPHPTETLKRLS